MANNNQKVWTPNETQQQFLKILENYPTGATLKDIELDTGKVFKTGAINVLVSKGLVVAEDCETEVAIVYRDTVIGKATKPWKSYRLAEKENA